MPFTLEIKNFDKIVNLAEKYPQVAEEQIGLAIRRSFLRVLREVSQPDGAPVGVNNALRDQWGQEHGRFYGKLFSKTPYANAIEFGTKPHHIGVKNNPGFQKWAAKKGLNPWAVAASIAKKGTRANPFFKRSIESASAGVNEEWKKALNEITRQLSI